MKTPVRIYLEVSLEGDDLTVDLLEDCQETSQPGVCPSFD